LDIEFVPEKIASHASQFGREQFDKKMRAHIADLMAAKHAAPY
jgi:hypothetical protein